MTRDGGRAQLQLAVAHPASVAQQERRLGPVGREAVSQEVVEVGHQRAAFADGGFCQPTGMGSRPPSAMKRSMRARRIGIGTLPSDSTVSWKARISNLGPSAASAFARTSLIVIIPR